MGADSDYVRADKSGALRVGDSRVVLDSILAAWSQGNSPETVQSQYPALQLEQVYGAIAWALAHPNEVAVYLKQQGDLWEQWRLRSESQPSALRDRLRDAKLPAGTP